MDFKIENGIRFAYLNSLEDSHVIKDEKEYVNFLDIYLFKCSKRLCYVPVFDLSIGHCTDFYLREFDSKSGTLPQVVVFKEMSLFQQNY
ncbi:hypothetical protein MAR_037480 [Mya arenaria]|uniref:Uncharacterized protein n=1 Tax=Mya arenaria TaxID=6604 RepID=A0ABY7FSV6_MYAAR|nr:hypothetical protein MAR_037480 [Mya arenaria]